MRRTRNRLLAVGALGFVVAMLPAGPAAATVHEIVGQWCSGQEPLAPPGISDPAKGNFARPLVANGFVGDPVPFLDGLLISFDYDHPASKVVGTGVFVVVGATPEGPLYLELIEPDPDFAAFQNCPNLAAP